MRPVAEINGVWKRYRRGARYGIKELLVGSRGRMSGRYARDWALRDVSFAIRRGESLGIVGHNGTGKSTLLSLLVGTMRPDRGVIQVIGRIASLLELGAGFHPELTGRENVFLCAAIHGMCLSETKAKFQSILDFSELAGAIDYPIRTYSAGMIARLGFSTVIHVPADLLVVDEVLAVGDERFQEKCRGFFRDFRRRNGTLAIVSHDMNTLLQMCDEGLCLEMGAVSRIGPMEAVVRHYKQLAETSGPAPAGE